FDVARDRIERGLADLERTGHRERLTDVYLSARWVRDLVLYAQDEFEQVLESGATSFAMAEKAGNRTMRSAIGNLLAPVHYLRGEYAEAKRWADITLEIGEAISNENAYTTGAALALASRLRLGERVDPGPYVDRIETGLRAGGTMQLKTRFVGEALLEAGEGARGEVAKARGAPARRGDRLALHPRRRAAGRRRGRPRAGARAGGSRPCRRALRRARHPSLRAAPGAPAAVCTRRGGRGRLARIDCGAPQPHTV